MIKRSLNHFHSALVGCMAVWLLGLLLSCERRPLEVIVNEKVKVNVKVNWQANFVTEYGETPNGMTLMLWDDSSSQPAIYWTNDNSYSLSLQPGTYYMVIFNELQEDYAPRILFHDSNHLSTMTARAARYTTSDWGQGTEYMYSPDDPRIAVAVDTIVISDHMMASDTTIFIPYEEYLEHGAEDYQERQYTYEIPEVPYPMTVDLYVKAKVKRRQSIKRIEGSISGMADGFYIACVDRTTEASTLRFDPEQWIGYRYGEEADSMGLITIRVPTFGLPRGKELLAERNAEDNVLTFHITLLNDSVQHVSFNVGKDIRYITPEGREAQVRYRQDLHDLQLELDLSDVIVMPPVANPSGAGFDARVLDWEDGGTIDIGM